MIRSPKSCAVSTVAFLGPFSRSTDLHLSDFEEIPVNKTVTLPGRRSNLDAGPCKKHCPSDVTESGVNEADWHSCL